MNIIFMIPRFFVIITKCFDLGNLEVYALYYVLGYSILEEAMYVGVETWLKTTGGIYVIYSMIIHTCIHLSVVKLAMTLLLVHTCTL